jgi:hypothetical protein
VIDSLVSAVGGRVEVPDPYRHDADQLAALARLTEVVSGTHSMVAVISGPLGSGRRTAAAVAAQSAGQSIIAIDAHRALSQARSMDGVLRALRRECALRSAVPLIAEIDDCLATEGKDRAALGALLRFIDSAPGPVFLTSLESGVAIDCASPILRVDWPVPETSTRKQLWQDALSSHTAELGDDLDGLALRYRFGAGGIRGAVRAADLVLESRQDGDALDTQDLVEGVRNNVAERLGGLAHRVAVKQSWDDLVLAPDTLAQVHGVAARVKHAHLVFEQWGFRQKAARGIGVSVLFSGAPGTGKTMVAGLIARELDLEMYQVDLSRVVSKWVGETEKNLAKVFEATDSGHALLLFDEADSLFSKRTEVKGAQDRHANLEVNYLLQRIESFGGVTILTTNLEASIDPALKRRLAGHVIFWPPEVEERTELWSRMLPATAPVADGIDFEELAEKYSEMTGANIRNSVFAAAFLAAAEDAEITQEILHRAARGEYQTMGYVLTHG